MGIFDKRKSISRRELKSVFSKDKGIIPKTGGKKYFQRERKMIEKEVFGPKYGSEISKGDWRRAVRDLESARKSVKTSREKSALEERIRYMKEREKKDI